MKRLAVVTTCFLALAVVLSACATRPEDPYLWLEEVEGEKSLDWVETENARSKVILEGQPEFQAMYQEAREVLNSSERIPLVSIHGEYVYNHWQDSEHVRGLWRRASLAGFGAGEPQWEVLLDIDALAESEGENWIFSGAYPCLAPDYKLCMIALSRGGKDATVYREFSVEDKAFVDGGFELPEAKSRLAWEDENTLLVATDWGPGSMTESGYPRIIKRWTRGSELAASSEIYANKVTDALPASVTVMRDGDARYTMIHRYITFFESEHFLLEKQGLRQVPLPLHSNVAGMLQGQIVVRVDEDWAHDGQVFTQGSVVAINPADFSTELVYQPAKGEAVSGVLLGDKMVHLQVLDNVIGRARQVIREDSEWRVRTLALPDNGVVNLVSVSGDDDSLLVSFESLTVPDSLYLADPDGSLNQAYSLPAFYDASEVEVFQRFAISKDGTRVPYFVMGRKDVLAKGNAPTIQYGYGGFLVPILPEYYDENARPQHGALAGRMWVARGGVLVLSNIRGGGEYGPAWHQAALKENRHLAYEDFFAIGEALVETGVTTPEKLGAIGRSNGGLLMGAVLTQRPDLYAAIDCGVPLLDMLRYHRLLAGASWMGEYGNPDVPAERAYLETYSPYQALKPGVKYPEVLFYTSTKDDRVHPGHARKMAARMREYGNSFLMYENTEGGHGGAANQDQLAYRAALEYAYFSLKLMK